MSRMRILCSSVLGAMALVGVAAVGFAVAGEATEFEGQKAGDAPDNRSRPPGDAPPKVVRLGTLPALKLAPSRKATAQAAEEIKRLIRNLAQIESPDFGLSGTMSGCAFSPVEEMSHVGAMILMDHGLKPSPDLRRLVELGPKSLPFLLDALDDKTPTRLVIKRGTHFDKMSFANELGGNPINQSETKVLGPGSPWFPLEGEAVDQYTVKVGDVCLVAIGQIVGRPYKSVRYQPTACIMLNSPTHDANLCRQVRAIWSSKDAAQTLFDSLLLDYATEGIFHGDSLDGWGVGSELQIEAALRLLFYFPRETAELIAGRLGFLKPKSHYKRVKFHAATFSCSIQ